MDVFVSWSGPKSKQVAEALRRYLPLIMNAVKPWLSSADIDAGARWSTDVAGKLQQSRVGIICLTANNLHNDWILFEAGALSKTLENTFVCPYLLGLEPSDVKGPLAQFQAMRANQQDTERLVKTINSALGESAQPPDQLTEVFETFWPKLKEQLDKPAPEEQTQTKRSESDMLEEILARVRTLPNMIERRFGPTTYPAAAIHFIAQALDPIKVEYHVRNLGDDWEIEINEPEQAFTFRIPVGSSADQISRWMSAIVDRIRALRLERLQRPTSASEQP